MEVSWASLSLVIEKSVWNITVVQLNSENLFPLFLGVRVHTRVQLTHIVKHWSDITWWGSWALVRLQSQSTVLQVSSDNLVIKSHFLWINQYIWRSNVAMDMCYFEVYVKKSTRIIDWHLTTHLLSLVFKLAQSVFFFLCCPIICRSDCLKFDCWRQ